MRPQTIPITLLLLGGVLVGYLLILNVGQVPLVIYGSAVAYVPEGLLLVAGYVLGVGLTLPVFWSLLRTQQRAAKALTKWESEDQKLLEQVQSDKEKQLEAKIATLEAALQRALKK